MQSNSNAYRTLEQTQIAKAMVRTHGHLLAIFWGFVFAAGAAFWLTIAPRPAEQYAVLEYMAAKALSWLTLLPQSTAYPTNGLQRLAAWYASLPQPATAHAVNHALLQCGLAGIICSFIFLMVRFMALDALRKKSQPKMRIPNQ